MPNSYTIGQRTRISCTFRNSSEVEADPTTVVFKYRIGNDVITTLTYGVDAVVVKDSVGVYHVDLSIDAEGIWSYRWEGTGAVITAGDNWFRVNDSIFY